MIRATTPTLKITVKDPTVDLAGADQIFATIRQDQIKVTKSGEAVTLTPPRTASVWLTQEESLLFREGIASVQLNWTYTDAEDGTYRRCATVPLEVSVNENLLPEVIT